MHRARESHRRSGGGNGPCRHPSKPPSAHHNENSVMPDVATHLEKTHLTAIAPIAPLVLVGTMKMRSAFELSVKFE